MTQPGIYQGINGVGHFVQNSTNIPYYVTFKEGDLVVYTTYIAPQDIVYIPDVVFLSYKPTATFVPLDQKLDTSPKTKINLKFEDWFLIAALLTALLFCIFK